jgi:hypothetical protein
MKVRFLKRGTNALWKIFQRSENRYEGKDVHFMPVVFHGNADNISGAIAIGLPISLIVGRNPCMELLARGVIVIFPSHEFGAAVFKMRDTDEPALKGASCSFGPKYAIKPVCNRVPRTSFTIHYDQSASSNGGSPVPLPLNVNEVRPILCDGDAAE